MHITRIRPNAAAEGRTIKVGDITIGLTRDQKNPSSLVVLIDAPPEMAIKVEHGMPVGVLMTIQASDDAS